MERINFENNVTKASAETFNELQDNIEEAINGTILYNNTNGTTSAFTLNDSIENYDYIEIYYHSNDASGAESSVKITGGSVKIINLLYLWYVSGTIYFKQSNLAINGINATFVNNIQWTNADGSLTSGDYIFVTKVIGYKQ